MNVVPEPASRVFVVDSLIGLLSITFRCHSSGDPNYIKILPVDQLDPDRTGIMKLRVCPGSSAPLAHSVVLVARPWHDAGGVAKSGSDHSIRPNTARKDMPGDLKEV